MEEKNLFDQQIKNAINEDIKSIEVPDLDDVWMNIEKNIQSRKDNKKYYKKIVGVLAALLTIAFVGISINNEGYASYFRNLNIFSKTTLDKNTNIQIDNKTPGERNNSEYDNDRTVNDSDSLREYSLSLDTAKDISSFQIKEPTYLPEGYEVKDVMIQQLKDKTISLNIIYTSHTDSIELTQEPIKGEFALALKINEDYGEISEKYIHGFKYHIIKFNNEFTEIIWDIDEVKFTLEGTLSEEALLKIASSIPRT